MGLDLVEFVMAVEDAFEVSIPDADAAGLHTPGAVVDYLATRLPVLPSGGVVLEQRAFYRVRQAIITEWALDRECLAPSTRLTSLLPARDPQGAWQCLGARLQFPRWRGPPSVLWWARLLAGPRTLGELARHVAAYAPAHLVASDERWTRGQIAEVVTRLVEHQFGVAHTDYTLASRFVEDLHVD